MNMDPIYMYELCYQSRNIQHPLNPNLIKAADKNDETGVNSALSCGANVNARETVTGRTALHIAASNGFDGILRALLSYRPSLQTQDRDGNFPINLAAKHGHLKCVKMLMSQGSFAFIGNKEFKNPLMLAAENGHFNIVEYLLNNKIKMFYQLNKMHESELTLASKNGHLEIVRILLETANSNIDRQKELNEALRLAVDETNLEVAELLIAAGANIE
ncbi:unnamed protein product [Hymenolepis diminuta]|uniref:Uncharacterized protein n=1 Tax=Hymenolepis diminuta TaxID=6216 RepID=A0A564YA65_HYMDI|nr:unnamed protein product [Hymenolepis diminuta]